MTVSCIGIDNNGKATVTWSQAMNGAGRVVGSTVTLPTALDVPNTTIVMGETSYNYTPVIDFLHRGTMKLYSSVYMLPRQPGVVLASSDDLPPREVLPRPNKGFR